MRHAKPIAALYLISLVTKVIPNLATKYLISLDSWTIYQMLDSIMNGLGMLPRSVLYSYYPLSYLPLLPFARVFGLMLTLKFVYPMITSLAVIPLYYLMTFFLKGSRTFLAALAIILIDDFLFRSTAVTPQGMAFVFLFAGMYFLLNGKQRLFLISGLLTLATHHLTSLVLFLFVAARLVNLILEHKRGNMTKGVASDLESSARIVASEKASVAYMALFFLSWFLVSNLAQRNVLSIYLGLKLLPALALIAIFLATLRLQSNALAALEGARVEYLFVASAAGVLSAFVFVMSYSTQSFLSTYSYWAVLMMPAYVVAPIISLPYMVKQSERFWLVFCAILLMSFILIITLRLNCVFDVFRLLPFTIFAGVVVLFRQTKRLGHVLLLIVVFSSVTHIAFSFERLVYNDRQVEAAEWARGNLPLATVATDTKMSALMEGLGRRPSTFEGSYWLFTQDDLAPWIKTFNSYRFADSPIRYIAVSQYMFKSGADISWSAKYVPITGRNIRDYNTVGNVVYNNTDVVIWEVNRSKVENAGDLRIVNGEKGFVDDVIGRFLGSGNANGNGEPEVDSRIAYGTTC